MKKKSTYQKLKEENACLKQQLLIVAGEPDTLKAKQILFQWRLSYNMEKTIWAGGIEIYGTPDKFQGFAGMLKQ